MITKPLCAYSLSALALFAGTFAAGKAAVAGETTLSVLGLEPAGGSPESVAAAVTEALRQRATSTPNYRLVPGRDLIEVKLVFSCPDEAPACMSQAAQSIGASKLVFGNVQPMGADAYLVTLKILDAGQGVVESWISEQITKAQVAPAALRLPVQKWFATLTGQAMPTTLKITGGVVGATVWLDGAQAGLLGADGLTIAGIASGPHQVAVSRVGYERFERGVTLASGASEKLAVQLKPIEEPEAAPAPAVRKRPVVDDGPPRIEEPEPLPVEMPNQGSRVAAWALLGTGIVAVGLGGYSSYKVSDINSQLDPYRRYPCTNGTGVHCGSDGKTDLKALSVQQVSTVNGLKQSGDDWATSQWVGYGVGAALLVGSGIFMYFGYFSKPTNAAANHDRPNLIVLPSFAPGSAGATAYLSF
jgi:hypothetical protein